MHEMKKHIDTAISVLLCAHNEEKSIESTLTSLRSQTHSIDIQIVLVDNLCTDRTQEVALPYVDCICTCSIRGKMPSLREGVKSCSGEIIAIADADTIYDAMWLSNIHNSFETNKSAVLVYGPSCLPGSKDSYIKTIPNILTTKLSLSCGVVNSLGYNMAIKKEALIEILEKIQPVAFSGWAIGTEVLREYGREAVVFVPQMIVPKCTRRIISFGYFRSLNRWTREWIRLASGGSLAVTEGEYYGFTNNDDSKR